MHLNPLTYNFKRINWIKVFFTLSLLVGCSSNKQFSITIDDASETNQAGEKINEIIVFCGNVGVGKSTLLNSLVQQNAFKAGVNAGTGLTQREECYRLGDKLYIDTPGLDDVALRKQAALEIEKALKHSNKYKIVFVALDKSGRIGTDDLTTINTICDAIQTDFEYGLIINKISKVAQERIQKAGGAETFLSTLNKQPAYVEYINKESDLEDCDDVFLSADSNNMKKLMNFANSLATKRIDKEKVQRLEVQDYEKRIEEMEKRYKEQLQKLEEERKAEKEQAEEDKFQTLLRVLGEDALHKAAAAGDNELITTLLRNKENLIVTLMKKNLDVSATRIYRDFINKTDSEGWTALHRSIHNGHITSMNLLLDKEYYIDKEKSIESDGVSCLQLAVRTGNMDIVAELLRRRVPTYQQDKEGLTPLHEAVKQGNRNAIEALLRADTQSLCTQDKQGYLPLDWALMKEDKETVQLLLEQMLKAGMNKDALLLYIAGGAKDCPELVAYLLDIGANIEADYYQQIHQHPWLKSDFVGNRAQSIYVMRNKYNIINGAPITPVALAERADNQRTFCLLLEKGATMIKNVGDSDHKLTPMHYAVSRAFLQGAMYLFDRGTTDLEVKGSFKHTPLHTAASSYQLRDCYFTVGIITNGEISYINRNPCVDFLVEKGASVNAKNSFGETPLHLATKRDHTTFKLLVSKGADVHAKNKDGRTPLHAAAEGIRQFNQPKNVELLLEKNANVHEEDSHGYTPLHLAGGEYNHDRKVVFNEYLHISTRKKTINLLLEAKANLEKETHGHGDDQTPLESACEKAHYEIVQFLIDEKKASLKGDGYHGYQALYRAIRGGNDEVVNLLLEKYKVKPDNEHLIDALSPGWGYRTSPYIVDLLLKYNANPNIKAGNKTMLQLASEKNSTDKKNNNIEFMKVLLNHPDIKKSINEKTDDGRTLLHKIVEYMGVKGGSPSPGRELFEIFIQKGADLDVRDKLNATPLHTALQHDNNEATELLLQHGANVSEKDNHGNTPLHTAIGRGSIKAIELLLQHGAKAGEKDNHGNTPLHKAATAGWNGTEAIEELLKRSPKIDEKNNDGYTPLQRAFNDGNAKVVEILLKHGAKMEDKNGNIPLQMAIEKGQTDLIELLVKNDPNLEAKDKGGRTPLHWAAEWGRVGAIELLLRNNANVDAKDKDGKTPFHWAFDKGHAEVMWPLLKHGAKEGINEMKNGADMIPLHWAVQQNQVGVLDLLLKNGAELEKKDKDGYTPLRRAFNDGNSKVMEVLLKHGAQEGINEMKNGADMPLLDWAFKEGTTKTIKLLLNHTTKENINAAINQEGQTPIHCAVKEGEIKVVKYLLKNKADVNIVDKNGNTPLYMAAEKGRTDLIELLVKNGANLEAKDKDSRTPLHWAAEWGRIKAIETLIKLKPDLLHLQDDNGDTPLHLAARSNKKPSVVLLLEKGANKEITNKEGKTPYDLANNSIKKLL